MNGTKLLLVEDDVDSALILKTILSKAGYEVLPAVISGEEAIEAIRQRRPALVLMDISISGPLDGIDTAKQILAEFSIPILYLTGYSDEQTILRAKTTNPVGFILKPYLPKEVLVSVEMGLYKSRMDQELQSSKRQLSLTLNTLPHPVFTADVQGTLAYINQSAEKYLQKSLDQVRGQSIDGHIKLFSEKTRQMMPAMSCWLFKEEPFSSEEYFFSPSDDKTYWFQLHCCPILNGYREIEGYVIYFNNMTSQHQAVQRKSLMAAALENVSEAFLIAEIVLNEIPKVVYFNQALADLVHFDRDTFFGQAIDSLVENSTELVSEFPQITQVKNSFERQFMMKRQNACPFLAHWKISPIVDENGSLTGYVILVQDITEAQLQELKVRQSQKIAAVGRLANGIAHDFNNLLTVISANAELLMLSPQKEASRLQLQDLQEATQKASQLVQRILLFSRGEKVSFKRIELVKSLTEFVDFLSRFFGHSINFQTQFPTEDLFIEINPTHLEQILMNLCLNARDAMPDGGTIILQLAVHEQKDLSLKLGGVSQIPCGRYIKLSVQDTGKGMDKATQEHLFEPFFTTKEVGRGTGLGLATIFGILQQYKAHIDLQSEKGKGTKFDLYFPDQLGGFERKKESSVVVLFLENSQLVDYLSGLFVLNKQSAFSPRGLTDLISCLEANRDEKILLVLDADSIEKSLISLLSTLRKVVPQLYFCILCSREKTQFPIEDFCLIRVMKPFAFHALFMEIQKWLDGVDI